MSKPAMLSDDAYAALKAHVHGKESLSDVILRFVPRPIRTFGDLERHLEHLERPVADRETLRRIRHRKRRRNAN